MRIAICGTRGIPACYGGFETFAEQLSYRLVQRGHEVIVYGRRHVIDYKEATYRGVQLRLLWAPRHKYLETLVHTFLSLIDLAIYRRADVVLVCNAANSVFIWIPRLRGIPLSINVDGIERMRAKWNSFGKLWYHLGEWVAARFAPYIVSDAEVIREYYQTTYSRDSTVIAYGYNDSAENLAQNKSEGGKNWLERHPIHVELGVQPGEYFLYVSRLEPENNAHIVLEAYRKFLERHPAGPGDRALPLVIVGDAPYAKEYIDSLHRLASPGVIFAGYRFGEQYRQLQIGASAYIQATEVGGTHPALVEAMGFANCVVVNGTPENCEVIAQAGKSYPKNDTDALCQIFYELNSSPDLVQSLRKQAFQRARECYRWDLVCDRYEDLFRKMCTLA